MPYRHGRILVFPNLDSCFFALANIEYDKTTVRYEFELQIANIKSQIASRFRFHYRLFRPVEKLNLVAESR